MSVIILSGSTRCGKTALAKAIARDNGYTFVSLSASKVPRQLGLTAEVDSYTPETQGKMLAQALADSKQAAADNELVVMDRSVFDFLAYSRAIFCCRHMAKLPDSWNEVYHEAMNFHKDLRSAGRLHLQLLPSAGMFPQEPDGYARNPDSDVADAQYRYLIELHKAFHASANPPN